MEAGHIWDQKGHPISGKNKGDKMALLAGLEINLDLCVAP